MTWRLAMLLLAAWWSTGCVSTVGATASDAGAPPASASGSDEGELSSVAELTGGLERVRGLFDLSPDPRQGKLWLHLPPAGERGEIATVLYVEGLLTGLGSNPVGLDRGQLGETHLLTVRRIGDRVLFEIANSRFRALSDDTSEQRATRESFATSVLWGGRVAALDADGSSVVDLTPFLLRDSHAVIKTLADTEQGDFSIDLERSAVDYDNCLAFVDNLELQAVLTYTGSQPGELVAGTAPLADAVTLVAHQSLIRLPDNGYRPRVADPRIGMYGVELYDFAAPLDQPTRNYWISRHRLEKQDPTAAMSPPVEPLTYYVDPGAPEPIRSALIDGASWWAEAFTAAGFEDAFRVELLPEGAHPLDVRYNVIQWVHRSTRGWSYGGGVIDPRTGELIKGHVSLGSLRVRQDRLLFEGLLGTDGTGSGAADDPLELALARIRQLSAHEVGHTLGLTHNFAASTYGDRASVMDYPAPLIDIAQDSAGAAELDVSSAYGVGLGAWDQHTVQYAYSQFAPGVDESAALQEIVEQGLERGWLFLSDQDSRSAGASDPRANLWDNGDDALDALELSLRVRQLALERFAENRITPGTPMALLEEVLAPVYFHHRYQLQAAAKTLGGVEYAYAVRGDGQTPNAIVEGARQRRTLDLLLSLLEPEQLDIPESVLRMVPPRPYTYEPNRELFRSRTGVNFDPLGAAATAADMALRELLQPERLARLVDQHRRDPRVPSVAEVMMAVVETVVVETALAAEASDPRRQELRWTARERAVAALIGVVASDQQVPAVRAEADAALASARTSLAASANPRDHWLATLIGRLAERPMTPDAEFMAAPTPPPGSPIGASPASADPGR